MSVKGRLDRFIIIDLGAFGFFLSNVLLLGVAFVGFLVQIVLSELASELLDS